MAARALGLDTGPMSGSITWPCVERMLPRVLRQLPARQACARYSLPPGTFSLTAGYQKMADEASQTLLTLTADIVAAHVSNNTVSVGDLAQLIGNVHAALGRLGAEAPAEEQKPAVSVRSSVKPDYIVCLEDGKKLTMLKRHLMTDHQMTPAEYRAKWNLSSDYPMSAPNYSETRRGLAKKIGLGRKRAAGAPGAKAPKSADAGAGAGGRKPRQQKPAKDSSEG